MGVDRASGPRQDQLLLQTEGPGARDDHEIRAERPRGQGRVHGVGVGVEATDQRPGLPHPGLEERFVTGRVATDEGDGEPLEPILLPLDDDDLMARVEQMRGGRATDPPVPADDDVSAQIRDRFVHPTPPKEFAQLTFSDPLDQDTEVVEDRADAEDDQDDGEAHRRGGAVIELAIADGRHGEHRLVDRFKQWEPKHHVADGPDHGDADQPGHRDAEASNGVLAKRNAGEQRPPPVALAGPHDYILPVPTTVTGSSALPVGPTWISVPSCGQTPQSKHGVHRQSSTSCSARASCQSAHNQSLSNPASM